MTNLPESRRRTGRRPGSPNTRARILECARARFARTSYDKVSVRAVADDAGVDAALVHHYFGTKKELFVASIELPVDPAQILAPIREAPIDRLGEVLAGLVLPVWESPGKHAVIALFRSAMAGDDVDLVRNFFLEVVLREIAPRVDEPAGTGSLRTQLVVSQMLGLLTTRHVLELDPLDRVPVDGLIETIAPTLQRYLTGPLPDSVLRGAKG